MKLLSKLLIIMMFVSLQISLAEAAPKCKTDGVPTLSVKHTTEDIKIINNRSMLDLSQVTTSRSESLDPDHVWFVSGLAFDNLDSTHGIGYRYQEDNLGEVCILIDKIEVVVNFKATDVDCLMTTLALQGDIQNRFCCHDMNMIRKHELDHVKS